MQVPATVVVVNVGDDGGFIAAMALDWELPSQWASCLDSRSRLESR